MTDEKKSQLRRSLDEIVPDHYAWLKNYDAIGANEFQRPTRSPPQFEMPRQPMAALPRGARIFVDGQAVGSAPREWSQPRHPRIDSIPSPPLTEAEERQRRAARKAKELADRQARSEARREREEAEAASAPHVPTMSEAAQRHFMKLLDKRGT